MARVAAGLILKENNQNLLSIEKKFPQNSFVTQYWTVNFRLYLLPQNTVCEFVSMHRKTIRFSIYNIRTWIMDKALVVGVLIFSYRKKRFNKI